MRQGFLTQRLAQQYSFLTVLRYEVESQHSDYKVIYQEWASAWCHQRAYEQFHFMRIRFILILWVPFRKCLHASVFKKYSYCLLSLRKLYFSVSLFMPPFLKNQVHIISGISSATAILGVWLKVVTVEFSQLYRSPDSLFKDICFWILAVCFSLWM